MSQPQKAYLTSNVADFVTGNKYCCEEAKKYCRRCECYFITKKIFCQCCGMQLRATPAEREFKEKMRAKKKPIAV